MKTVACVFLILFNEVLSSGSGGKEYVHFKIQVPEIIKHHIHTKTVFIHVHKTIPKKKSPPKKKHPEEEHHHEDWSSWSSYEHHEDGKDHGYKHYGGHNDHKDHVGNPYDYKDSYQGYPMHDYSKDSYQPQYPLEMMGYSPMHQQVEEIPHNDVESYGDGYEEGYRKGLHSETGGEYSDVFNKFHDSKHEEGDEHDGGYGDESYGKTDAGRYFVTENDAEYDQAGGKYESDKRRISARIFLGK